ncbi:MbcA/ParS/Xre antitoxin family protein [Qipengyuania qiaonensis]|uniref:MbcA/ParS/Xre antitoxin family protein n=1 Tax=Qipengyuania qiaonensis TaxID=2867240 RepID=A0ABS7J8G9_9SPHN|nr:MbcA/ParS/Xre antitoxin family protein [Qipengyuania qiaonensis]MBX7481948.1 MbcA/ParS/Xre antitoxin family protein [Qipengyuania qiaonensis]
MTTRPLETQADDGNVLTAAVARIAEFWGFTNHKLGAILGVSEATASRLRSGKAELDPASKSFEAAQFLLRLFRSLDALLGSDDMSARAWLTTGNLDLDARPIDLIDSFRGLITVCDYVDAHRARV